MEFKRQKLAPVKSTNYLVDVNFYLSPPVEILSLEEFENHAIDRLKALRMVEYVGMKHRRNTVQFRDALALELQKEKSQISLRYKESELQKSTYDHISHFILRLAYCKSEELRRWFLHQECDLFRARLMENSSNLPEQLKQYGLNYEPTLISPTEELYKKIEPYYDDNSKTANISEGYCVYKVPFIEVLDLVRICDVYLENGYAYTTVQQFISVIVSIFRIHLSKALAATARRLPALEEDTRLLTILSSINNAYFGKNYNASNAKFGEVVPEMLDDHAKTSYPLCMRTLHENLRANHHLRHGGRLQYGFFLKSIGLKLQDALRFWREELSKKLDVDQFEKKFAYNIRHSYGQEGVRKNYTAYSCMKIITSSPPGPGEYHGCPFKHMDKSSLLVRLRSLSLAQKATQEIVDLASGGHYQVACTRCFEASHNMTTEVNQAFNHPNEYYEASRQRLTVNEAKN